MSGPRHRVRPTPDPDRPLWPLRHRQPVRGRVVLVAAASLAGALALGVAYVGAQPVRPTMMASPLRAGEVALWGASTTPRLPADPDRRPVELGTRFFAAVPGQVTAILFYKHPENGGLHTGAVWDGAGRRLADVLFTGETASGWQVARLAHPVQIAANTPYVVSYHAPHGRYADDTDYFGPGRPRTIGPLTAAAGVYHYGTRPRFPTASWRDSTYYVDVAFVPSGATEPTSSPSPTATSTLAPTSTAPPTTSPPTTTAPVPTTPPAPTTPPSTGGWPGASNTGWQPTGVRLTAMSCPSGGKVSTAGTVIDGKDIGCGLYITADNVTIKRSRITATSDFGVRTADGVRNFRIEDSEIAGTPACAVGLVFSNWTGVRLNIHGCSDGAHTEGNVLLQDSWIHDLYRGPTDHNDAVQATGSSNVTLRHNRLENPHNQTSCILIGGEFGQPNNWLVENNYLDGGNYTIYLDPYGSNRTIRDNVFTKSYVYGALNLAGQVSLSGNTYTDGSTVR
ncbi:MAG TPA: DUF4082 domain-containing protein [Mycobacteriales bacterium]|nr:DUF4082 domain-containing protein [Mycobacteriales bacterium]